jgi:hypothetical protein
MLTDAQKSLLMMRANLDQITATIRQAMADPECADDVQLLVVQLRDVANEIVAKINSALDEGRMQP